ncbi:hypothetical protein CK203_087369 [Vitis vinifera]|uniref:DUF4283 domain-containing protein n=1 Tax=Vitis vinifera TaxID=29760 RepID=A0A438D362_VITVI|nr:hypothetical protein CK203_087369 [Vitis vinifera]
MVETLRRLGCANGGMISQKEEEPHLKPSMVKTFAEVVKMPRGKDRATIRVEVTKKELYRNLNKLAHYVGNLGLAKLERGKVLMEFELLIEAEQAIKLGSISAYPSPYGEGHSENDRGGVRGFSRSRLPNGEDGGITVRTAGNESGNSRKEREVCRNGRKGWGEACTRGGKRRLEVKDGSRLEALLLHADGTRGQSSGSGQVTDPIQSFDGSPGGSQGLGRLTLLGLAEPSWCSKESEPARLVPFSDPSCENGPPLFGLSSWKISEWAKTLVHPVMSGLDNRGPSMPLAVVRAQDGLRRLSEEEIQSEGKSKTDCALLEEDARYENVSISIELMVSDFPFSPSPIYGQTSLGEYYDLSRAGLDLTQGLHLDCVTSLEGRGWEEASWEESDLARFRRKEEEVSCARKRVSDCGSPMKIRLLSWNVHGANDSSKRKVIKAMIRSQKVDLFWSYGRDFDIWDKRTLEVLEMEMGRFSISCRLRNVEDGNAWIFTGVYGSFSKEAREILWEELGAIRGIWDDPCGVVQSRLPKPTSDHFPILLKGGGLRRGPSLFRSLTEGETELKREAKETFKKWVLLEETHWRQVSRSCGLRKGQEHGFLSPDGQCPSKKQLLDKLRSIGGGWRRSRSLNHNEAEVLEQPFTKEEIHSALMEMNGDKAPGPDWFTVPFGNLAGLREGGDCGPV